MNLFHLLSYGKTLFNIEIFDSDCYFSDNTLLLIIYKHGKARISEQYIY